MVAGSYFTRFFCLIRTELTKANLRTNRGLDWANACRWCGIPTIDGMDATVRRPDVEPTCGPTLRMYMSRVEMQRHLQALDQSRPIRSGKVIGKPHSYLTKSPPISCPLKAQLAIKSTISIIGQTNLDIPNWPIHIGKTKPY
jgi:hypothetical protein